jgi:hypothetical protein
MTGGRVPFQNALMIRWRVCFITVSINLRIVMPSRQAWKKPLLLLDAMFGQARLNFASEVSRPWFASFGQRPEKQDS